MIETSFNFLELPCFLFLMKNLGFFRYSLPTNYYGFPTNSYGFPTFTMVFQLIPVVFFRFLWVSNYFLWVSYYLPNNSYGFSYAFLYLFLLTPMGFPTLPMVFLPHSYRFPIFRNSFPAHFPMLFQHLSHFPHAFPAHFPWVFPAHFPHGFLPRPPRPRRPSVRARPRPVGLWRGGSLRHLQAAHGQRLHLGGGLRELPALHGGRWGRPAGTGGGGGERHGVNGKAMENRGREKRAFED